MINPKHAYKLSKNLNGLKQAPNAWYEYLLKFLSQQGYYRGGADNTMFIKRRDLISWLIKFV